MSSAAPQTESLTPIDPDAIAPFGDKGAAARWRRHLARKTWIYKARDTNILPRVMQIWPTKRLIGMWKPRQRHGRPNAYRDASKNVG
jgi:hypothetical protein